MNAIQSAPFIKKLNLDPQNILSPDRFERAAQDVKAALADGTRAILVKFESNGTCPLTTQEISTFTEKLGRSLGRLLVQNEKGDQVVTVYDRDRLGSMNEGARYHQTREGGSIHTDNVNVPEIWNWLVLSCLAPAEAGGESILVDGLAIHQKLKKDFPHALKILESNYIWEMRGVADELYHAPIITYDSKGQPLFRHLRPYMESAHKKANSPMTIDQLYAIDLLDALTNSLEFQSRFTLAKGDVLITVDSQTLHGRTCFSDSLESVTLDEINAGKGKTLKRTMQRLWVKAL